MYRAYKQFRFGSSHLCVPRPNAAAVISQFQNRKRQLINKSAGNSYHVLAHSGARNKISSKYDEKELLHCTSLGYRDIQCTHSHPVHYPLPVSLEPELDLAHTHQCYSLAQAAEQSGESHHVLTKLHGYGMEGKRRRIASFADAGGPRAPLRSNFDDQKPFLRRNAHSKTLYNAWSLLLEGQSLCVVLLVVLGLVRCLRWKNGYEAGKKPVWEDFPVPEQSERLSCHVSTQPKLLTCKCGFLERLTARSSGVQKWGGSHGGLHGTSSDLGRYAG